MKSVSCVLCGFDGSGVSFEVKNRRESVSGDGCGAYTGASERGWNKTRFVEFRRRIGTAKA